MKLSDIPQFVHGGNYEVDVPFGYLRKWIESLEKYNRVEINPDFQRGHVWNDTQRIKYVEYLFKGGQSSRLLYWNHPAWLSKMPMNSDLEPILVLVDGKQRLTSCLMFMENKIPIFGHYLDEYDDKRLATSMGGPRLRMQVNNLHKRKDLLQWYVDLNDGGVVHTNEEIERVRRMIQALG